MARPTTIPQWDTNLTNTIALIAAHKTDGYPTGGYIPLSGEENTWKNLVYQWINWLQGNILDGNWEYTGNVQVDGTLTGQSSITGTALHFTTAVELQIPILSSTDNIAGAPGAHHTRGQFAWSLQANTNKILYEIELPVGAVIKSYTIDLNKQDTTNAVAAAIVYETSSSENFASTGVTSGLTVGNQSLGESGLSITVVSGRPYYIRVVPGGTATPAADSISNVRITYTL